MSMPCINIFSLIKSESKFMGVSRIRVATTPGRPGRPGKVMEFQKNDLKFCIRLYFKLLIIILEF